MIQYEKMSVMDIFFHDRKDFKEIYTEEEKDLFGYFTQTALSMEEIRCETDMAGQAFQKARRSLFKKMDVTNRAELSALYIRWLEDVIDHKVRT